MDRLRRLSPRPLANFNADLQISLEALREPNFPVVPSMRTEN